MLQWLTPDERRGASVLVLILLLGASHDACVARRMTDELRRASADSTLEVDRSVRDGSASPAPAAVSVAPGRAPTLDLNRATSSDLETLPGIGPVLARRIAEERGRRGRFSSVEELLAVRGVGPRLLARLRPRVTAGAPSPASPPRRGASAAMQSAPPPSTGRADSASAGGASAR